MKDRKAWHAAVHGVSKSQTRLSDQKTTVSKGREVSQKRTTEDHIVGWHHLLNEHEFESTLGVGDGQGGLACCYSWGHKESDTTD